MELRIENSNYFCKVKCCYYSVFNKITEWDKHITIKFQFENENNFVSNKILYLNNDSIQMNEMECFFLVKDIYKKKDGKEY